MPNWCHNTLTVTGKEVSEFKKKAKSNEGALLFNNFAPMPEELKNTKSPDKKNPKLIKKYGADNWYDWHCKNWGTKWDARVVKLATDKKDELRYFFDTAWNPPIAWLKVASKMFSSLKFVLECTEESGSFVGTATAINGKVDEDFDAMNGDGESYEVIRLDGENPVIVKFLDKGLSLTLRMKEANKLKGGEIEEIYQHLFKVEYMGKVKMLELSGEFIYLINDIRVKGKTCMVVKRIVEGREFIGIRELETLENFIDTFDLCMHNQSKSENTDLVF